MSSDDEERLFLRMRAGDPQARDEILRRYGPEVHRRLSLSRPEYSGATASELVQTVLKRLLEKGQLDKLEELTPDNFVPFMVRRAEWARGEKYKQVKARRKAEEMHAQRQDRSQEERLRRISELIEQLESESDRTLLTMRMKGYSFEEIAKEMGKTSEALRKQFGRLKQRLQFDLE